MRSAQSFNFEFRAARWDLRNDGLKLGYEIRVQVLQVCFFFYFFSPCGTRVQRVKRRNKTPETVQVFFCFACQTSFTKQDPKEMRLVQKEDMLSSKVELKSR